MDGIIIINKPKNFTSHDVVRKIKKITNEKVGHTGTLDPMATGVLPLLIGKGTLCSKYLINHDKRYEVILKLGVKTNTADLEGTILEEKDVPAEIFQKEKVLKILSEFIGKQEQIPPIYSAIKVNGKKLYEYARRGQEIEIKPRQIEIYEIELIEINKNLNEIKFQVYCSKGTYIRSLCEDIAKGLGTIGTMSGLKRLQVGNFKIENAIEIEKAGENIEEIKEKLKRKLITIEQLFIEKEEIVLSDKKVQLFLNGTRLTYDNKEGIYRIYNSNRFIGIGIIKNNLLKRDIVIN